jgi:hypothetical protein
METVWLEWHGPFPISELDQYDNENLEARAGIYVLLDSRRVERGWSHEHPPLYVGKVYGGSFWERMLEHTAGGGDDVWRWIEEHRRQEVTIKVGIVMLEEWRNLSKELVDDIENLLIFRLQTPANVSGKESYGGRNLRVINTRRYHPLPEELRSP